ncbi:hypothetical protein H0H87_005279, partial [Tephrocybe sp. NHM501043]
PETAKERHASTPPRQASQASNARLRSERRQLKRRRLILDAVELPTLAEVLRRATRAEEVKKIEKWKNENTNLKKRELCFDVDTIRDRLRSIGLDLYPITLDHSVRDVMVTRQFMSTVYGGGQQCCWASVSEKKRILNNHNFKSFMYLSLDFNCHAPEMPGSPGLYFAPGGDESAPVEETQRLFTRIAKTQQGIMWQYQGQYKVEPSHPLTTQEWGSVHSSIRNNWAAEIYRSTAWGKAIRVRIALRKALGRSCTDVEFQDAYDLNRSYEEITIDEIGQALLCGHEKVAVWTMKCVGYDEDFQRDLVAKVATWTPPPPKKADNNGAKETNRTNVKKEHRDKFIKPEGKSRSTAKVKPENSYLKSQTGKKWKNISTLESELSEKSEDDEDDEATEDEEKEGEPKVIEYGYRPRGTRSRPIIVD